MTRLFATAVAVLLLAVTSAWAQQGTSSIRGRVVDSQGAVLPGVALVVTHQSTGIFRDTASGSDGTYLVTNLIPGIYTITAKLEGFKTLTRPDINLPAGDTATLELQLEVGTLSESVTVSGSAPQVDVTSASVGGNVSLTEVQAIPSLSHTVIGYLQVIPGVVYTPSATKSSNDGMSVNGQTLGIHYYVDGGSNTGLVFSGGTGTRVTVPSDVIQEIQAITSQMSAEYGGRTGAVINTITKQGANNLRGSAFGFYTDDSFIAANYFGQRDGLAKPDARKHREGFTLGGPIARNRLFFFGALENTLSGKASAVSYPTNPDKSFTSEAVAKGINMFIRIDQQINADNTYAVRFLARDAACTGDPGCRAGGAGAAIPTNGATLATLTDEWQFDSVVIANYNRVVSPTKLNVVTFSSPRQSIQTGVPGDSPTADTVCVPCLNPTLRQLTFDDGDSYFSHHRWEPQYRVENAFSWFMPGGGGRSHDMKFGGLYNFGSNRIVNHDGENGIFGFTSNNPFNPANPSTYPERLTIRVNTEESYSDMHIWGAYAQDKWQLTPALTVNLGLRYDLVFAPTPNEGNPLFDDPKSYPVDWNNLQPRLGFAYSLNEGRSVVRGGWGQFFQTPIFSNSIQNFWRQGVFGTGLVLTFPTSGVADPGPSSGRLPADPYLVNGPVVDRAALERQFPAGEATRNTATVFLDNPDRELPRSRQATLGYERQFFGNLALQADYIHNDTRGNFVQYDLNPGLRVNTSRTGAINRTDTLGLASRLGLSPFTGSVFTLKNLGREQYDGLNLSFEKRFSRGWASRVSYTIAKSYDDTSQNNYQVLDISNADLTWGPSGRTHILSLSGQVEIPQTRGLNLSGTYRYMSGTPITLINSNVDVDRNGVLADLLPAGTYNGTGPDAMTLESDGGQGGAIGPAFAQLDMRLSYRVRLRADRSLDFGMDVFNVTNEPNFSNPSGDQRLPTFLVPNTLASGGIPRQLQVSMRITF